MEFQIPVIIKWLTFSPQRSVARYKNNYWEIDMDAAKDFPADDMLEVAEREHRLIVDRNYRVVANYLGPRDAVLFKLFPGPAGFEFERKLALRELK